MTGVEHILRAPFADRLESVDLSRNPCELNAILDLVCDRQLPRLRRLDVRQRGGVCDPRLRVRFGQLYPNAELVV